MGTGKGEWKWARSIRGGRMHASQEKVRKDSDNGGRRGARWCNGPGCCRYKQASTLKMEAAWSSEMLVLYHTPIPKKWRQHGPLKCWYLSATLHGIITQKTIT